MNFISNLLLGTPTETEKQVDRPKVSDEEEEAHAAAGSASEDLVPTETLATQPPLPEEENSAMATAAATTTVPKPPSLPRASFVRGAPSRSRSLSRVYNQVPRGRPDFSTAQLDMIEYYAHLAMIETDADRVKEEDRNLRDALRGCQFRNYGRLYSRLQIASLCISIGAHQTDPENLTTEDDEEEGGVPSDFKSAAYWNGLREQLIIVKTYMLRKDANVLVPVVRPGYDDQDDDDIPLENDELDGALEKHEMFQDSYEEVLLLMEAQEVLSSFCEQLTSIDANAEDVVKRLESAVNSYERALQKLFVPEGVIGEDTKSHIPEELTKFLLVDISKKPAEAAALLLRDALKIMSNDECAYSHVQLKHKMKAVLTKWCESILDIPKLVQLGYGGVMAPIVTGFEDDVSSYGVEEDRLLTQKPGGDTDVAVDSEVDVEPEPVSFRQSKRDGRRTSFADEVFASHGPIPSRYLPVKSPRMRRTDDRKSSPKRSPSRNSSRGAVPSRSGREHDRHDDNDNNDDGSNTQDPTASINQHGGATPDDRETALPRRVVPIRDSDEDAPAPGTPTRSRSSPKKRKRKVAQRDVTDDDLWEDPVELNSSKRRTYMDWTEDETEAVREGYEKFGKKWAMIKHNCQHRLSRRTNVQIKDKWRTMVKSGEIEDIY